jgi:hypothetical protein
MSKQSKAKPGGNSQDNGKRPKSDVTVVLDAEDVRDDTGAIDPVRVRFKGRPGRKRKVDVQVGSAILAQHHAEVVETMVSEALGKEQIVTCRYCGRKFNVVRPDRELLMHIDDKVTGKAPQSVNLNASMTMQLNSKQLVVVARQVQDFIDAQCNVLDAVALESKIKVLPSGRPETG